MDAHTAFPNFLLALFASLNLLLVHHGHAPHRRDNQIALGVSAFVVSLYNIFAVTCRKPKKAPPRRSESFLVRDRTEDAASEQ